MRTGWFVCAMDRLRRIHRRQIPDNIEGEADLPVFTL